MIPVWPDRFPNRPNQNEWKGGPIDERISFQPDKGPPIERMGSTEVTEKFDAGFDNFSVEDVSFFRSWFKNELRFGTLPFAWRDPITQEVRKWKIQNSSTAYSMDSRSGGLSNLSLSVIKLPGTPWWSSYAVGGTDYDKVLRLPYIVADYENSVFGINLQKTPASSVALESGTYDVYTTDGTLEIEENHVILAGDIPVSAPGTVTLIRAFSI